MADLHAPKCALGGTFTPTESTAVAVVYALLIGLSLYRDLRLSQLPKILVDSFITSATVLLVVSAATVLSWIITFESVPQALMDVIATVASGKTASCCWSTCSCSCWAFCWSLPLPC